jgi:hypothetical protein
MRDGEKYNPERPGQSSALSMAAQYAAIFPRGRYGRPGRGRPGFRDRIANFLTAGDGTATLDTDTDGRPSARTNDPPTKAGGLFLAEQAARAATTRQPRVPRRALARSSPGA